MNSICEITGRPDAPTDYVTEADTACGVKAALFAEVAALTQHDG